MQLSDKKLFRQQCYVDGEWVDADSGEKIAVSNHRLNIIIDS